MTLLIILLTMLLTLQVTRFLNELNKYEKKKPFVIVFHGNCIDGGFSNYIASTGLIKMGFTIALQIPYYHNMDNFTKHMDIIKDIYVMFIDVTPLPDDYMRMRKANAIVCFIDHHPINSENESGKSQLELFTTDNCNYISVTDRSSCGTTLACHVFNPYLLTNRLIYHINKFDNLFMEEKHTKSIAIYNRFHMNDVNFYENILGRPLTDIISEGEEFEKEDQKKVNMFLVNSVKYQLDVCIAKKDVKVNILETLVDDELYANSVSDEFYNTHSNEQTTIVITRFYPVRGGTKFSFRSKETIVTANMMASLVGGGGHIHSSGYLCKDKINSYAELIK